MKYQPMSPSSSFQRNKSLGAKYVYRCGYTLLSRNTEPGPQLRVSQLASSIPVVCISVRVGHVCSGTRIRLRRGYRPPTNPVWVSPKVAVEEGITFTFFRYTNFVRSTLNNLKLLYRQHGLTREICLLSLSLATDQLGPADTDTGQALCRDERDLDGIERIDVVSGQVDGKFERTGGAVGRDFVGRPDEVRGDRVVGVGRGVGCDAREGVGPVRG